MANDSDADFAFPLELTLLLNTDAPLIKKLSKMLEDGSTKAEALATHVYRLALLSHRKLSADEMQAFLEDSYQLLLDLSE